MAQFKWDQKMICLSPFMAIQANLVFISGLLFFTSTALWIGIWIGKTFFRESEHVWVLKFNLKIYWTQIIICEFHSAFPSYSDTALCFQEITCQSIASGHLLMESFWRWRCSLFSLSHNYLHRSVLFKQTGSVNLNCLSANMFVLRETNQTLCVWNSVCKSLHELGVFVINIVL